MKRIGVFIDVGNQFYCINKKWEGRKLNYETYKVKATEYGNIVRSFAYGTQVDEAASKFISCLHHLGFESRYKSVEKNKWYSWDVGISIDMVRLSEKIDIAIIGNSNKSIVPALLYLKEKGIRVIVMACGISKEVKEACDQWIEINEDMLEAVESEEVLIDKINIT